MGRKKSQLGNLEAAFAQLDKLLASEDPSPSALKALQTKIDSLSEIERRRDNNIQAGLSARVAALEEQLKAFEGVDPSAVGQLTEENQRLAIQNENLIRDNQSLMVERNTARAQVAASAESLKWLCGRATEDRKVSIATAAFIELGKDAALFIDTLLPVGTHQEFVRVANSKSRLIETYRDLRKSREPSDQRLAEFAKLFLKSKHDIDADDELRRRAAEVAKRDAAEEHNYEAARFHRELQADAMRQSANMSYERESLGHPLDRVPGTGGSQQVDEWGW